MDGATLLVTAVSALVLYYWLRQKPNQRPFSNRPPFDILYPGTKQGSSQDDIEVDIIAVHGLGSNVDWSWTWKDSTPNTRKHVHWLKDTDMLPAVVPKARIVVYNYDSKWHANAPQTRLQLCGEDLARHLHTFRDGVKDRPIVFLGHSLGGLVIQNALLHAETSEELRYLIRATVGIVALGSPFRGTKMQALASVSALFMSFAGAGRGIIGDLVYGSDALRDRLHEFCLILSNYEMPGCCFFELYHTDYGRKFGLPGIFRGMTVPESSACIDGWNRLPLQTDHLSMNKYSGPHDRSFLIVSDEIRKMCTGARKVLGRRQASGKKGHWMAPFDRNECFVGRDSILEQLFDRVPPSAVKDGCHRTALYGLGGIGKTQIALEIAFRVQETYPDCSVFWVPAMTSAAFEGAYRDIGRRLQTEGLGEAGADDKKLVKKALSESPDNWLLIIDNADDTELFFDRKVRLSSYIPSSPNGSILFTTRRSDFAFKCSIPGEHIINVPPMSKNEALELFLKVLDDKQDDIESIMKILNLLKYLPLAVKQASAYVAMTRLSVKKYLEYCQSSEEVLLKLLAKDFEDTTRYEDSNNPVAMTWMISFKQISQGSPLAAEILKAMCFLADRDIPIGLVSHNSDQIETDEAIGSLLGYAFVTRQEGSNLLQIHRLVRLAMQNWLRQQGKRHRAFSDTVGQLTRWLCRTNPKSLKFAMIAISHVRTVLAGPEPIVWFLLGNLLANSADCWKVLGYDHARFEFLEQRFKLLAQLLGPHHRKVQRACFKASESRSDRFFEYALRPRSTEISMRSISENDPLIGLFEEGGVFDEGERLDANLPDKLTLARYLCNSLYERLKREAPALFNRSTALPDKEEDQERIARQVSHEALAICETCLSAEHDDFGWLEESFRPQISLGEEQKTEQFMQHIREISKQWQNARGSTDVSYLKLLEHSAEMHSWKGMFEPAVEIYHELLSAEQGSLGVKHPRTIRTQQNLADALIRLGRYTDAEPLVRQLLHLRKEIYGPKSSNTLNTMAQLAELVEPGEKQQLLSELYSPQAEAVLGVRILYKIGLMLEQQGNYDAAEQIYRRILQVPLDRDLPIRWSMSCLCALLVRQGRLEEAEGSYQILVDFLQKELGETHDESIDALSSLADVLRRQGKPKETKYAYRKLFRLCKKARGSQNQQTLCAFLSLSMVLEDLKDPQADYVHTQAGKLLEHYDFSDLTPREILPLFTLGLQFFRKERYIVSEQLFRGILPVKGSSTKNLDIWDFLAKSLYFQASHTAAEQEFRSCLKLREETLGAEAPDTLNSMWWLAECLKHQKKYPEAEAIYRRLWELEKQGFRVCGTEGFSMADFLVYVLEKQQKESEATVLWLKEVKKRPTAAFFAQFFSPFFLFVYQRPRLKRAIIVAHWVYNIGLFVFLMVYC